VANKGEYMNYCRPLIIIITLLALIGCSSNKIFIKEQSKFYKNGAIAVLPVDGPAFMEGERLELGEHIAALIETKLKGNYIPLKPSQVSSILHENNAEWLYTEIMKNNAILNLYGHSANDPDLYVRFGSALNVDYLLFSMVVFSQSNGLVPFGTSYLPTKQTGVLYQLQLIECEHGDVIWEIKDEDQESGIFSQPNEFKIAKKLLKKAINKFPQPNSSKIDSLKNLQETS
jgi:hypothetical protein